MTRLPDDPLAEYQALQQGAVVVDASSLGVLEVAGRDRAAFLHGLVTNDVRGLPLHRACWACFLTAKGKVEALVLIAHQAQAHWLIAPASLLPRVRALCERYLMAEDVQLRERRDVAWLGLQGPQSRDVLARVTGSVVACAEHEWITRTVDGQTIGILGHAPFGLPGALCAVPSDQVVAWGEHCQRAGATPAGLQALQMARVEAGWPWYGIDADETCLLPETGWERTATSYTKGCYIGQEIVARATQRGRVARHLLGLRLACETPPAMPCAITNNGAACGTLTSAVWSPRHRSVIGLAMLARSAWPSSAQLRLESQPPAAAQPVDLPHLPWPAGE